MTSSPDAPDLPDAPNTDAATPAPRPGRRWLRWGLRLVALGMLTIALAAGLTLLALGNLQHPRVKPHVVAAALEYGGVALDFRALAVSPWSGTVHAEGLTLAQPDRFASHAPNWLSVGRVDGQLDVDALLDGRVHLLDLRVDEVALELVRDAETDTFGLLFPSDPDDQAPPTPLSKMLDLVRGLGVDVDQASLSVTRVALTEVAGEQLVSQVVLEDLALSAHVHETAGEPDLALSLHPPEGARSRVTWQQTESAERDADGAPLRAGFEGSSEFALDVELAVRNDVQLGVTVEAWPPPTLVPETRVPLRAELALGVTFDQARERTRLDLQIPSVLGGVLRGHIAGELHDSTPTTLRAATGRVDAQFDELPLVLEGVQASGFRAALVLNDATLGAEGVAGLIDLDASLERGSLEGGSPRGHVEGARLSLETRAASTEVFETYALELDATRFDFSQDVALTEAQQAAATAPVSAESAGADGSVPAVSESAAVIAVASQSAAGEALVLRLTGPTLDTAWVTGDPTGGAPAGSATGAPAGSAAGASTHDVLTVGLARLELRDGPDGLTLLAPDARAEGAGLLRAGLQGLPLTGDVALDARELAAHAGRDRVNASPLRARVALHQLSLDGAGLFGLGGALDVAVDGDVRFAAAGQAGDARGLAPRLHIDLDTGSVHGDLVLGSLSVRERGETSLSVRGMALAVQGEGLDTLAPPRARGLLRLEGHVGHVDAGSTSVDLPRVALALRGEGGAYDLQLDGRAANLEASGESFAGSHPLRVVARADLRAHVYDAEARLGASAMADGARTRDEADPAAPDLLLTAHAALGSDGQSVEHRVNGSARNLAAVLRPYLGADTDLRFEELRINGEGTLTDALASPARSGRFLALSTDVTQALRTEQHFSLALDGVRYATPEGLVTTASTTELDLRARSREGVTELTLTARLPHAEVVDGRRQAELSDLSGTVVLSIPDLDDPSTLQAAIDLRVVHVGQNFLAGYPIANAHLEAALDVTPVSATLSRLTLVNPAGRTRLELSGAYEGALSEVRAGRTAHAAAAIYGREALGLSGVLEQDLEAFSGTSFARTARGTLSVPLVIESGDLSTFRVSARVVARGVFLTDIGVAIERLEGDIPIVEVITLTPTGYTIQASPRGNPLSHARFPDVQPFLARDAFLSADRIILGDQVIGPLAGNLRVEGTTLALDRLQFGYRGGVVTTQLEADVRRRGAYMTMRGNATGVQGRQATDILDANFALRFAPETLALDGSVQLVRMSRSHLEALLNVLDPYREDTNMNTVRALLPFGHPRTLQARIEDGLMDLELQLGGIAGVASIQGIRAIPIAPLLDDYVAPIVDPLFREPDADIEVRRNQRPARRATAPDESPGGAEARATETDDASDANGADAARDATVRDEEPHADH